jgi:hypothetical protein
MLRLELICSFVAVLAGGGSQEVMPQKVVRLRKSSPAQPWGLIPVAPPSTSVLPICIILCGRRKIFTDPDRGSWRRYEDAVRLTPASNRRQPSAAARAKATRGALAGAAFSS